ncbi:glycoside hydrolase family 3 N-terminal domain-containing protein [Oceanobacillus neutriphilus]|uniref:glycoside hydrolase family 3 N-terminal domain-containing protein n=1 Tax=Oceanobacillus neutriphilus TaxID=531815 RepID=UPI0016646838|nr:glycoside hydrolase family 3 N-terminal domain-containing protein [Oceanobacillus neutriphilus]
MRSVFLKKQHLEDLLKQMTIDEKIGQLSQLATPFFKGSTESGKITGPLEQLNISDDLVKNTGSVLGASGAKEIRNIQEQHLKDHRLSIPLLFMSDIIHGYETIFPVPLGIGSSWDIELAEKSAEIAAKESAVSGIHVTFAPMVDLVRDPRWGRVMESTGEDSYLNSEFAKAQVRGFQGEDLTKDLHRLAACVKHFAAYGAAEAGRDYNTVNMSERQLREIYLPAFQAALDAGSKLVMTSFNTVDGIPATGNKKLMRDILRDEWGFDGVTITDWGALKELIPHGVAEDESEAAYKAIQAGVDIEMMTTCYPDHLKNLIENKEVEEELLNDAVRRILQLKNELGLFENPYRGLSEENEEKVILNEEHRKVAKELAAKSCVLLQNNNNTLPINTSQKVALIGPFAENNDILGPWSWKGNKDIAVTLTKGIEKRLNNKNQFIVAKGSEIESITKEQLQNAISAAEQSDIIVLALGEHSDMSGEAGSRSNIKLPDAQLQLVDEIYQLGKPTVAVLFNGRPLDLHGVFDKTDAVLEAWFPGTEGGTAITEILYGDVNPSGKLSMSFPYSVGQVPVYYNHYNTGRPQGASDAQVRYVSQFLDIPNEPLFPFGYGLSYTTFSYQNMRLSAPGITPDDTLQVKITVKNTGKIAGDETVQLYVRDMVGEVVRPLKELKGFKKIHLKPQEEMDVTFELTEKQLRYYHSDLNYDSDNGKFEVYVGPNSKEVHTLSFTLTK